MLYHVMQKTFCLLTSQTDAHKLTSKETLSLTKTVRGISMTFCKVANISLISFSFLDFSIFSNIYRQLGEVTEKSA